MENVSEDSSTKHESHAHEHEEHHQHGHHRHERHVEVIVNGKGYKVEYVEHEHGRTLVEKALEKSHNSGQKPESWELRDEKGEKLDQEKKVSEYYLGEHSKLFLSLKAGGGGAIVRLS